VIIRMAPPMPLFTMIVIYMEKRVKHGFCGYRWLDSDGS
jgi:hypothetical protein